jgi:NADH:ubiquinone oxidoreductase subunit E
MFEDVDSADEPIIHVCVNSDCRMRGSEKVLDLLQRCAEDADSDIEVNEYVCFAACEEGPNVLVEHTRTFCSGVEDKHVEEIFKHAQGQGEAPADVDRSDSFIARKIFNLLDAGMRPGDLE